MLSGVPAPAPAGTYHQIARRLCDYMNPPTWTDDELLRELRAALREPAADESFIRAARIAFTGWRAGADPESWRPGPAGLER
jgi:hypothetical protein